MKELLQGVSLFPKDKAHHDQAFADEPILTERERHRVLYAWNDTETAFPEACVHELFEQQVARDPDAVAIVFRGRRLSYRELNQHANQVARTLRKRGVGPEILVGVCLQRSPEMVIGLLAVWKAGGAYVPLDPAYPQRRLSFMASDADVKVLLTDEKCKHLIPSAHDKVICLDSDWPVIAHENTSNLSTGVAPSNLASVMYTSGSTGQPKGAMILHSGLVNYLCWAIKVYAVDARSSLPVHSSISFDLTVTSLYPALLAGGQVELLPEDIGLQSLATALRQAKNRSLVKITPAHLEVLSRQLSPDEMAGIAKVFVIGGEYLLAESLSRWRDFAPATRLLNEYGPTETVVGSCIYEVRPQDPRHGPVPIGRPIANTQVYVLDANLHPVPTGMSGELYIGGAGVGRGYLNRPELTRERFLIDPFSGRSGAHLYKTGDLCRHRKDGTLEFLGRVDDQVKVRGYRIELGEIEAMLATHPNVQSCKVLAREDTLGDKQLVGYVIARKSESLEAKSLQNFLKQSLPDHMVPAYFVFLDSFPLTQNGKIDNKSLPAPSYKNIFVAQEFAAPRTETEKKLAAIWTELLKVERVGIHDDFFDLGGHSLLAVKAMSRIQEAFGVVLSMQSFFPSATIAGLARAVEHREESNDKLSYAFTLQPHGEKPAFWLVGGYFSIYPLLRQLGINQPFYSVGFKPECANQLKAPFQMEDLVQHLVSKILKQQTAGPFYLGGICQDGVFAYEVARQLTMRGQDVGLLVLFEPANPNRRLKDRLAVGFKRLFIRLDFRVSELLQLKFSEIVHYASDRWIGLKWRLNRMSWLMSYYLPSLKPESGRADLERILFLAASHYRPQPLHCPTVIFRGSDWPIVSAGDPYFGWRELLTGRCETYEVPGYHMGIFSETNAKMLADQLRVCLQNARQTGRS